MMLKHKISTRHFEPVHTDDAIQNSHCEPVHTNKITKYRHCFAPKNSGLAMTKKYFSKASTFFILIFLFPLFALAGSEDYFAIGNNLYKEGKYNEAIEHYQKLLNQNYFSFELYYNMGNAYYKKKEYPKAILYYEKAKKINAADEELNHNLKLANSQIKDKVDELPQLFISSVYSELVKSKTADAWAWLAIKTMLLALAGFLLFLFSSNYILKKTGFFVAIAIVIFSLLFAVLGFEQKKNEEDKSYAILIAPSANVVASPDEKATRLFVIHEGIKLKIDKKENDWLHIKLSNGNAGWIKATDVENI